MSIRPTRTPVDQGRPRTRPLPRCSPTPTPTAASVGPDPLAFCAADCDGGNSVDVAELLRAVRIANDQMELDTCSLADVDGDGAVEISELMGGVRAALEGCEVPSRLLRRTTARRVTTRVRGGVVLVNDRETFDELWAALPDDGFVPTVDFEQCTVAFVFDRLRPSTGYSIGVKSVRQLESGLVFDTTSHTLGQGCLGLEVITHPVEVLALPKFDEGVGTTMLRSERSTCCGCCR